MDATHQFIQSVNSLAWGPYMLVLILGTGLFLTIGLKFTSLRKIPLAFRLLFSSAKPDSAGEISAFNALMTSLSATIGTGNIVGVATAITLGGPGALFWMWITALVGMATKYAEVVLAVNYREVDAEGNHVGGPMYYIKNGLGPKWRWLAVCFSIFGMIAGFGIGNMVQSHSVADVLHSSMAIPPAITGVTLFVLVGIVVVGGVKRIAVVAGRLVPLMVVGYLGCGLLTLIINIAEIPAALALIVNSAFNGHAATGGFAGAAVSAAIHFGVARGVFSNEAGLGSAPIAHAHAKTKSPIRQGLIAMLGTFIDTLLVCTITGLVIVTSGLWSSGVSGAPLTSFAFDAALPGFGQWVVTLGLVLFTFSTILGWSVYGERCVTYLFGIRAIRPFRILWTLAVPIGTLMQLNMIWLLADTFNALMALPNLIALLLLSPVVFKLTKMYFAEKQT